MSVQYLSDKMPLVLSVLGLLLIVIAMLHMREHKRAYYSALFMPREEASVAAPRHADIEGALKFLDTIQDKPELMDRVGEYARQAMAASLLQRLAILSETISYLEKEVQTASKRGSWTLADRYRDEVEKLQQEQIALTQLAESYNSMHSMS